MLCLSRIDASLQIPPSIGFDGRWREMWARMATKQRLRVKMIYHRILIATLASSVMLPSVARADEGGASFWLPGQQGSFAAVPSAPGWTLPIIYYHGEPEAQGPPSFSSAELSLAASLGWPILSLLFRPTHFPIPYWTGNSPSDLARALDGWKAPPRSPSGGALSFERTDSVFGRGRPFSDRDTEVEQWNQQLHDLSHRGHSGWRLQRGTNCEHEHQPLGNRCRRRLHISQPPDRTRILGGCRPDLQL